MNKEQVHEALCNASDEEKMRLALACQINGVHIEKVEQVLANILTGVEKSIKPAIEIYKYLGGE